MLLLCLMLTKMLGRNQKWSSGSLEGECILWNDNRTIPYYNTLTFSCYFLFCSPNKYEIKVCFTVSKCHYKATYPLVVWTLEGKRHFLVKYTEKKMHGLKDFSASRIHIHIHIHTYILTYMHTYIHYIHTMYIHTYSQFDSYQS